MLRVLQYGGDVLGVRLDARLFFNVFLEYDIAMECMTA